MVTRAIHAVQAALLQVPPGSPALAHGSARPRFSDDSRAGLLACRLGSQPGMAAALSPCLSGHSSSVRWAPQDTRQGQNHI